MLNIIKRYGVIGSTNLLLGFIFTKLFFYPARLIRFPFEIRNKKYVRIGKGFTSGKYCRIEAHPVDKDQKYCISIGENVQINDSVHIVGSTGVYIGNNVLIAGKVFITDLNHGSYGTENVHDKPTSIPHDRQLRNSPVRIEDNVWIGEFVSVLPGVVIGSGSIIGTMSVVTRSIPPNCIAVGSPAKVIKIYNEISQEWEKI